MATTNTDKSWYWYIRKKGRRYYLGLVANDGTAPTSALTIDIYYDEIPDDITSDDDTFPIPAQFEMGIIKGVAAELLTMQANSDNISIAKIREYKAEFEKTILEAIHYQIGESQQPMVIKPLDFRDDHTGSNTR